MPRTVPARLTEPSRLAAVEATGLVATGSEEAFDRLTRLAALLLDAPLAFVTVVDTTRSWYKSCVGLAPDAERFAAVEESFCQYVVASDAPLILDDARAEQRTRENPSVVSMGMVAWAGFPIRAIGGEVLGTLCAVDTVPRHWTARDALVLETLAAAASGEIALRGALAAEQNAHAEANTRAAEAAQLASLVADLGERSAALARTLSRALLPPRLPEIPGLEVAARYQPARGEEVVGDFFEAARSSWCIVMGDVCGKGPEAATVTALAHYTLRAAAARSVSPSRVLGLLNDALLQQRPGDERFLTVALANLRAAKGGVLATLTSAGHPLPLLRRGDGTIEEACQPGMALGMFERPPLSDTKLKLGPGDTLVFYTDGVTEARRGAREFGVEGLRQLIAGATAGSAAHLAALIEAHVGDYRDGLPRDDTAILVVQVPLASGA
ncbi:MAG: PP2C family protein-serine/threonine phosphatase [Acidimicrobiales bacterium]